MEKYLRLRWKSYTLGNVCRKKLATVRPGRNTVWQRQMRKDIKTEAFKG